MVIQKKEHIVPRKIHTSYFLIDISDHYHGDRCALYEINQTGMFLWEHMDGKCTDYDLAAALQAAIIDEVDPQALHEDVRGFVEMLLAQSFVEVMDDESI